MRKILFRAKTLTGEMINGYYAEDREWAKHYLLHPKQNGVYILLVKTRIDPKTLGQYTGLTDTNGIEICEGDIISIPYITPVGQLTTDENYRTVVEWKNGAFVHKGFNENIISDLNGWCKAGETRYVSNVGEITDRLSKTVVTIVGNIHETPDLLTPRPF